MKSALLIYPHQLFAEHPGLAGNPDLVCLVEDTLFFGDPAYPAQFHKQKLWYHRATMKRYQARLEAEGYRCRYADYEFSRSHLADTLESLARDGIKHVVICDPTDFIASRRLEAAAQKHSLTLDILDNPGFMNTSQLNCEYRNGKKRWFMADFYKFQRQRLDILMDGDEPEGGRWSFDEDNRKKVPKKLLDKLPFIPSLQTDTVDEEAKAHVEDRFAENPGNLAELHYPTSHEAASSWLDAFLEERLQSFGDYEDAIVENESWLWHSILTPMLNTGLLTPRDVVNRTLEFAERNEVPINSLEGFLRQIIGWREFMRATYEDLGVKMRTTNFWKHERKLPECFYSGETGIVPIDDVIGRLNDRAYCHHIERLMVLGGFMFLCEIDPDDVYRWFMEMFIDSYDWVMVPNAYAMSQNADGGLITTKPYFSGSNYVLKMSNYQRGEWCDTWDGLYWRWIWNHRKELGRNPRWAMMCRTAERMDEDKMKAHLKNAEAFLATLDGRTAV